MQTILGFLPCSEKLNYLAQRYVTKNLPPSKALFELYREEAATHHRLIEKYGGRNPKDSTVYEIGCGWHLAMSLLFSALGYSKVIALDITDHVKIDLINTIIGYMKQDGLLPQEARLLDRKCDIEKVLRDDYRIDLLVPCDSARTPLPDDSIDAIYSHNVLEHVPPNLLPGMLQECHRVIKNDGVISFHIDYGDHYCSIDRTITIYNFLRYGEAEWKKFNPRLHYMNRLRHVDFLRFFEQAGFDVVDAITYRPPDWQAEMSTVPFPEEFTSKYTMEELSITSANVVLKATKTPAIRDTMAG